MSRARCATPLEMPLCSRKRTRPPSTVRALWCDSSATHLPFSGAVWVLTGSDRRRWRASSFWIRRQPVEPHRWSLLTPGRRARSRAGQRQPHPTKSRARLPRRTFRAKPTKPHTRSQCRRPRLPRSYARTSSHLLRTSSCRSCRSGELSAVTLPVQTWVEPGTIRLLQSYERDTDWRTAESWPICGRAIVENHAAGEGGVKGRFAAPVAEELVHLGLVLSETNSVSQHPLGAGSLREGSPAATCAPSPMRG